MRGGRLLVGADALQAARIHTEDRVAMVGTFAPFIKALKGQVTRLWVVDKHQEALKPDERPFWVPPERAKDAISQASVVIITGSALVEGGIDSLLGATANAREVILAGPTASSWPPPFFERGVTVLGGIRVLDGSGMLRLVGEGGSGYFFDTVAEKICVIRDRGSAPHASVPSKTTACL